MAVATTKISLLFMAILLLHDLGLTSSSRPIGVHPLPQPPVNVLGGSSYKSKPKTPTTEYWFSVNHYKIAEADAFRPTTPGHSPGVGHGSPPSC